MAALIAAMKRCVECVTPVGSHTPECKKGQSNRRAAAFRKIYGRRKRFMQVEMVRAAVVVERDKGICHLCGEAVRVDQKKAIDHVIPISYGGPHCYDNVALTHFHCNDKKSAANPHALSPIEAIDARARAAFFRFHGFEYAGAKMVWTGECAA